MRWTWRVGTSQCVPRPEESEKKRRIAGDKTVAEAAIKARLYAITREMNVTEVTQEVIAEIKVHLVLTLVHLDLPR